MTSHGGIKIPLKKHLSASKAIEACPLPSKVFVPLAQHLGATAPEPVVGVGDSVKTGQVIASAQGDGVPLHAPISGTIESLCDVRLPQGKATPGIVITGNGRDEWVTLEERADWDKLSQGPLLEKIRAAGLVGLGGATFPAHIKLTPKKEFPIDTVIINGCECEPYLTSDYRLMLEKPEYIVAGARISMHITGARRCIVAIEEHSKEAISSMRRAVEGQAGMEVQSLPARYPQGAEKVVIERCTGRALETGELPFVAGVIVHNVGTTVAICAAVRYGMPLVERIVTVSGEGIVKPANLRIRIGTPVSHVLAHCGTKGGQPATLIAGGPMMGVALETTETPVCKGTSAILSLPDVDLSRPEEPEPCIKCGRCVYACPRGHLPYKIGDLIEAGRYSEAADHELMDCLECGCCAFMCPSGRPMIETVKKGKQALKTTRKQ